MSASASRKPGSRLSCGAATAVAATLSVIALTAPALAVCPICNASVRLDTKLASCFVQRIDSELQRFKAEARGFIIVNLSDCSGSAPPAPSIQGRGSLPTNPGAPKPLDSSFVADGDTIECLGDAITKHAGPMDPGYLFDLAKICGP